jgi:hypothetical protein
LGVFFPLHGKVSSVLLPPPPPPPHTHTLSPCTEANIHGDRMPSVTSYPPHRTQQLPCDRSLPSLRCPSFSLAQRTFDTAVKPRRVGGWDGLAPLPPRDPPRLKQQTTCSPGPQFYSPATKSPGAPKVRPTAAAHGCVCLSVCVSPCAPRQSGMGESPSGRRDGGVTRPSVRGLWVLHIQLCRSCVRQFWWVGLGIGGLRLVRVACSPWLGILSPRLLRLSCAAADLLHCTVLKYYIPQRPLWCSLDS